jgi:predicted RNA-binding Zn ribbon-like protein
MTASERFGPTRRGGPVFRWLGEALAIDLANTVMVVRDGGDAVDLIATPVEAERWLQAEAGRIGDYRLRRGDLDALLALRDATRALLTATTEGEPPPSSALEAINSASEAAPTSPLLATGPAPEESHERLRLAESGAGAGSSTWLLGKLARATIELLTGADADRLQLCRAPSCGMFYLGARRWCCSACGNRARAARHYEKRRGAQAV